MIFADLRYGPYPSLERNKITCPRDNDDTNNPQQNEIFLEIHLTFPRRSLSPMNVEISKGHEI